MAERVLKVNQLIKKELAEIIKKEQDFSSDVIVTITRVETSSNLIQSKVWVSVIPENRQEEVLQQLNGKIYNIQQGINKRLRMRPVPRIKFLDEKETKKAARVEELLKEIHRRN